MTFRSSDAIEIDAGLCTGCGACIRLCPAGTLALSNGKAKVTGEVSLHCGHCEAVCPVGAVRVASLDPRTSRAGTFEWLTAWSPFGAFDPAQLVRLMASRRSCRHYRPDPVSRQALDDLINVGLTAPSGTNSQRWAFTLLPSRRDVEALGRTVADFYRRLNRLSSRSWLRTALRWVGRGELDHYYRTYRDRVQQGLEAYDRGQRDMLFHGATAAIVISSRPGASCPAEDDLLATQNILLAAHAMGLGSCLIGFVVSAMAHDRGVKRRVGIPDEETVHAVIGLGHPDERYARTVGRLAPLIRTFEA